MTPSGFARIVLVIGTVATAQGAGAQQYPAKPVRIVTGAVGGASDFVARLLGPGLSTALGQPVIVENRGGGLVPVEIVARAQPDGYGLLYYGSALWLLPLMQSVSYDATRDFIPVSMAVSAPSVVVVNPSVPVKSIKELIALAKARPGVLNYASATVGTSSHLSMELFKALSGVDIVRVGYKGGSETLNALIAGEVQVFITAAGGGLMPQIAAGKVRALAVGTAQRSTLFPNLPTVSEAGLPGYESGQVSGIFAPAKTPVAIVNRLNAEIVRVLNRADVKEKFFSIGADVVGSTPQEAAAMIQSETIRLGKVIKDAKIRLD